MKWGYVRFGDNLKGEIARVRSITISPSCDLIEGYLVDGAIYNLLSVSWLCEDLKFYSMLSSAQSATPSKISPWLVIELIIYNF